MRWTTGPYDTGWPVWCHQRPPWTSWRVWHRFWRPRWWSSRILGTEAPEEWLDVSNTWEAQRQQTPACDWLEAWEKTGRWVFCICSDLTSPRCRWSTNGAVTHCRWTPTFGWWRGARTPWSPCPSGSGSSPAAQPGSSMMTPRETTGNNRLICVWSCTYQYSITLLNKTTFWLPAYSVRIFWIRPDSAEDDVGRAAGVQDLGGFYTAELPQRKLCRLFPDRSIIYSNKQWKCSEPNETPHVASCVQPPVKNLNFPVTVRND